MSDWQNAGAQNFFGGKDFPTKKALKELIAQSPEKVHLYSTDAFGPNYGKSWMADILPEGVKFTVTGPNPYTSRKWYATVEKLANGNISVK